MTSTFEERLDIIMRDKQQNVDVIDYSEERLARTNHVGAESPACALSSRPVSYSPPKLRRFSTSASAPATSVSNLRRDEVVGEDECSVTEFFTIFILGKL